MARSTLPGRSRAVTVAAAAGVSLVLLAGCGGSGDDTAATTTTTAPADDTTTTTAAEGTTTTAASACRVDGVERATAYRAPGSERHRGRLRLPARRHARQRLGHRDLHGRLVGLLRGGARRADHRRRTAAPSRSRSSPARTPTSPGRPTTSSPSTTGRSPGASRSPTRLRGRVTSPPPPISWSQTAAEPRDRRQPHARVLRRRHRRARSGAPARSPPTRRSARRRCSRA